MQLSTNMTFREYISEMEKVFDQIDHNLKEYDQEEFEQVLKVLVYKLGQSHINFNDASQIRLNLSYDGTDEGLVQVIITLAQTICRLIYDDVPEITGDLDKHIMRILLLQFSLRLIYGIGGREEDPLLGEIKTSSLIGTIQQKPVKLYNLLRDSLLRFISTKYPDAIILQEDISNKAAEEFS